MSAVLESKTAMRKLATKAQETVDNKDLTLAERKSVLDDIHAELKTHSELIGAYEESMRLAAGGEVAEESKGKNEADRTIKSVGRQVVDSDAYKAVKEMFDEGARRQFSHTAHIKTVNTMDEGSTLSADGIPQGQGGAAVIPQFLPGVVDIRTRRLLVADLFAQGATSAAAVSYLKQTQWQNNAAGTAEKGKKPQSDQKFQRVLEQVGKIANIEKATDELMQDAPGLLSFIQGQMVLGVLLAEDQDLLTAVGYPSVNGLLNRTGMQATIAASGTSANGGPVNVIDKVYNQITAIRQNAFVEPDAVVFNPGDWQNIRLAKDANNQYYGGGPFTGAYGNGGYSNVDALWGLRVVQTPAMPVGTALVGGYRECAQLFRRQGITVEMTNSNVDDFENNLVTMRAELREALAVYRPGGFGKVTPTWS